MSETEHSGSALRLERLLFFSDAVFAIAITLLILEIPVPELPHHAPDAVYWDALGGLWPKFFAFVLSFMVIGRFWFSHHQLFSRVTAFHRSLMWPNLILLLVIAFMPFATAFLGGNLGAFVPAQIYNLTLLAAGLTSWRMVRLVDRHGLAGPGNPGERGSPLTVVLAALTSIAIAFVLPQFSQFGMTTVPLWTRVLARRRPAA